MPKLPPFALADAQPRRRRPYYLLVFFFFFAVPLFAIHLTLLNLPYFWDELGQFIPTALDLLHDGAIVPHSTVPNVHPPGVEAFLALFYRVFGYSIPITRIAMLITASAGLLILFLLAIELSKGTKGAPAFLPPLFLMASPLFYTQSMMAQLDMPAMVFSLLALLLFIKERYRASAAACVALVLVKETGLVVPLVFLGILAYGRKWKVLPYFVLPAFALSLWLLILHRKTGFWLGDPGFAHYNVSYSLHPVRVLFSFLRRLYYLFLGEFRWVGTFLIVAAFVKARVFRTFEWFMAFAVSAATVLLVSAFGGAELERYLLPVLPLFYVAVGVACTYQRRAVNFVAVPVLLAGLVANLFWNPPYPFPFENNLAMVDFVRLQQAAARYVQQGFGESTIATAWPYTAALKRPEYGFVEKKLRIVETNDFHYSSIAALSPSRFDVLIVYTRTWEPEKGVLLIPVVKRFLHHFYDWQPEITAEECARLGLYESTSWEAHGQRITVYARQTSNKTIRLRPYARTISN
jgi:hypothetical protein